MPARKLKVLTRVALTDAVVKRLPHACLRQQAHLRCCRGWLRCPRHGRGRALASC